MRIDFSYELDANESVLAEGFLRDENAVRRIAAGDAGYEDVDLSGYAEPVFRAAIQSWLHAHATKVSMALVGETAKESIADQVAIQRAAATKLQEIRAKKGGDVPR